MSRRKRDTKKPRFQVIHLGFDQPTTITGLEDNLDGTVTFFGEDGALPDGHYSSGLAHERETKDPKPTVHLPGGAQNLFVSMDRCLRKYSHVFAIDTNMQTLHSEPVAVAVFSWLENHAGGLARPRCVPLRGLEFWSPTKDKERIGWAHAIQLLSDAGLLADKRARILLVVDAHFDEHDAINARTIPMVDKLWLPRGVDLAYASSDRIDTTLNELMAASDREGKAVLRQVATDPKVASLEITEPPIPWRAHRVHIFTS